MSAAARELAIVATPTEHPQEPDAIGNELQRILDAGGELPPLVEDAGPGAAASPAPAPGVKRRPAGKRRSGKRLTKSELQRELRDARRAADELRAQLPKPEPVVGEIPPAAPPLPPPPPDPERGKKHAKYLAGAFSSTGSVLSTFLGDHMRLDEHEATAIRESAEDSLPALESRFPALGAALDWLPGAVLLVVIVAVIDRRLQIELAIRRGEQQRTFSRAPAALASGG